MQRRSGGIGERKGRKEFYGCSSPHVHTRNITTVISPRTSCSRSFVFIPRYMGSVSRPLLLPGRHGNLVWPRCARPRVKKLENSNYAALTRLPMRFFRERVFGQFPAADPDEIFRESFSTLVRSLERRACGGGDVGGFLAVTFSLHVETPVRDSLVRGVRSEKVQFRKNLAGSGAAGEEAEFPVGKTNRCEWLSRATGKSQASRNRRRGSRHGS